MQELRSQCEASIISRGGKGSSDDSGYDARELGNVYPPQSTDVGVLGDMIDVHVRSGPIETLKMMIMPSSNELAGRRTLF